MSSPFLSEADRIAEHARKMADWFQELVLRRHLGPFAGAAVLAPTPETDEAFEALVADVTNENPEAFAAFFADLPPDFRLALPAGALLEATEPLSPAELRAVLEADAAALKALEVLALESDSAAAVPAPVPEA
jgi:hypothetical protein